MQIFNKILNYIKFALFSLIYLLANCNNLIDNFKSPANHAFIAIALLGLLNLSSLHKR